MLKKYEVSYMLVSAYERANLTVDLAALENLFPKLYESKSGGILIFGLPEG